MRWAWVAEEGLEGVHGASPVGNGLGVTPALGISGESCSGLWEMKLTFPTLSL